MNRIDELLFEREITALRVAFIFRLLWMGYGAVTEPFQAKSSIEIILIEILMVSGVAICVISMLLFRKKRHVRLLGTIGSILDVVIVAISPIIWYISVGGGAVNPAYMIKGPFYQMLLWMTLGYSSFAIQPVYILIVLIGNSVGYIGHFFYLVLCGRATFTTDYVAHNIGEGININFTLTPLLAYIAVGIGLLLFANTMRKSIYSAVRNETVSNQLSRFFSPKVRDEIMSLNEQVMSEKGKLQDVAVLFSDVRDFTKYCEDRSPEEVVSFLKEYQSLMVDIIFKHNGTLDKFIGDGIMATFGTPATSADDAENAVRAAIEMSSALKEYNKSRALSGRSEIKIGIGMHFGQVIVGSVGAENRLEYTVVGDTVNIASRLESATKELKREIVFSEELWKKIGDRIDSTLLGPITIRGREKPMLVYSV